VARARLVFFSMPFKVKDVGGVPFDFDEAWHTLLEPGVPSGWDAIRLDESNEPGSITDQFKHYLRVADVAVFDLTSGNPNVLYELGLRDVFAPGRRVLVARDDEDLPFNLRNENTLRYPVRRRPETASAFTQQLERQILAAAGIARDGAHAPPDEDRLRAQLDRATTLPALVAVWKYWARYSSIPADVLLRLAAAFHEHGRLDLAVEVARRAYTDQPDVWDVARTLGWYLRKSGSLDEARMYLEQALALNAGDVESMGMLGGMHKRKALELLGRGEKDEALKSFALSKDTYERAVDVEKRDVYNLVNVGALTFVTQGLTSDNPAYTKIFELVSKRDPRDASTWDLLALGEACLVLGRVEDAKRTFADAYKRADFLGPMRTSVTDQLDLLEKFGLPAQTAAEVRSILAGEKQRAAKTVVLLHLSDIHFGKNAGGENMHRFRDKGGLHLKKTLAQHVFEQCKKEKRADVTLFLVVSGDVAYLAKKDEYEDATKFITDLKRDLELDNDHVVIVPGNHDVNWKLSSNEKSQRFDEYLNFVGRVFGDDFATIYPSANWDFDMRKPRPEPHMILSVHKAAAAGIVLIGFNSCVVEDEEQHFGAIGENQLALAREMLAGVDPAWVRVAVLHHHVLPLERKLSMGDGGAGLDGTIVRDFAALESSLHRLKFDMILHGHKHDPGIRVSKLVSAFEADDGKSMIVCGAGSAGVEEKELPAGRGNHFAVSRIHGGSRTPGADFVDVDWMELPLDAGAEWKTIRSWKIKG
jgi:tetratricopeptide (TPR) repeat protein